MKGIVAIFYKIVDRVTKILINKESLDREMGHMPFGDTKPQHVYDNKIVVAPLAGAQRALQSNSMSSIGPADAADVQDGFRGALQNDAICGRGQGSEAEVVDRAQQMQGVTAAQDHMLQALYSKLDAIRKKFHEFEARHCGHGVLAGNMRGASELNGLPGAESQLGPREGVVKNILQNTNNWAQQKAKSQKVSVKDGIV